MQPGDTRTRPRATAIVVAVLIASGCGGGSTTMASDAASAAEWQALREARPEPLTGAARVAVGEVAFLGPFEWNFPEAVDASLGVTELVVAGLLRRPDLNFVERRRFEAGAEAERLGTRPRGQPPAGVSRSADFLARATWIPAGAAGSSVEIALVDPATGEVAATARRPVPADADPVLLARTIVAGIAQALDGAGRLPAWDDPLSEMNALASSGVSGVTTEALGNYLRGLAAEEVWRWEDARRGYAEAAKDPRFHEARSALARTARLRLGGTLAES